MTADAQTAGNEAHHVVFDALGFIGLDVQQTSVLLHGFLETPITDVVNYFGEGSVPCFPTSRSQEYAQLIIAVIHHIVLFKKIPIWRVKNTIPMCGARQ